VDVGRDVCPSVPGPDGRRKKKTYLVAFIDDATRVITHAQIAFTENTRGFLPAFKVTLLKRGLPQRRFVDNGANLNERFLAWELKTIQRIPRHDLSRAGKTSALSERLQIPVDDLSSLPEAFKLTWKKYVQR